MYPETAVHRSEQPHLARPLPYPPMSRLPDGNAPTRNPARAVPAKSSACARRRPTRRATPARARASGPHITTIAAMYGHLQYLQASPASPAPAFSALKKSQTCRCSVSRCPHAPRERGIDGRWRFACEFNSPTGTAWLHSQPLTRPTKGAEFLDMECPARACVSCRTRPSAPLYSCMHHVAVDLWH